MSDLKATLKLPKTDFPMKADLPKREPAFVERWDKERIHDAILDARKGAPLFTLHDGPPYANGHLHYGHVLNKVLKDVVVKFKTMTGFRTNFIPGWDCHGLPIERALEDEMGTEKKQAMSKVAFRQACRAYAEKYVGIQRDEFKRLGVFGAWERPYKTMTFGYEATIAREFGKFLGNGGATKGKKPVLWCWNDRTALADAEVEYAEREDPSIWVKFFLPESEGGIKGKKTYLVIWTTTPWTLPANLGIALNPELEYVAIEPANHMGEAWIVAKGLLAKFLEETKTPAESMLVASVDPRKLENKNARHPWMDRGSKILLGEHVTLEAGTGCVHTAPGHGEEDFDIGRKYGLEILTPVNDRGILTDEAAPFSGEFVTKANPKITQLLREKGALVAEKTVKHDYPHCWRCKKPVIFRGTTQWFISMEKNDLRKKALSEIDATKWIPAWGRDRIYKMVENRPDWVVSRQRTWGVPIVAFRCGKCGETHATQALVERVVALFEKEGADAWYSHPANELIGDEKCPKCGAKDWATEDDILDVWFESGVSFAAVCEPNPDLGFPVDLYLEGSDQHRGWFHSTLLAAVGTRGKNAYRQCLTHGFVVDAEGKKLAKSAKNYDPLEKVLEHNGADILRLWVAASDFREDVRVSKTIIDTVAKGYMTFRNNGAKALLGNLYEFDPARSTAREKMPEIDRYMLHRLSELVATMRAAYDGFEFHTLYHAVVNFCAVDLSAFYVDVLKDRLYCGLPDDRRSAQTVLFETLSAITRAMAPVLSFTCEEVWSALPAWKGKESSVHLARFPEPPAAWKDDALAERWKRIFAVRAEVLRALEGLRGIQEPLRTERKSLEGKPESKKRFDELDAQIVGKSDDAGVELGATGDLKAFLEANRDSLREALAVSHVKIVEDSNAKDAPSVKVAHAPGSFCMRCRRWYPSVKDEVCERCAKAVAA